MLNRFKAFVATRWIRHISDARINGEKEFRDWKRVRVDLIKSMQATFHNSMRDDNV